jgi:hypothetical protein
LPIGARVRKLPRFEAMGWMTAGTVVSAPYEKTRGFWFVDVLWDGRTRPEPVYLPRIAHVPPP